ncbi:divalent metal cation transporter [Vicingus serpentipes]|uniref:Divalent metal cation transporter n=1 Tax=Vicingus serpentipes TaxID=1926625 RepID=A0A5C6RU12_9FLAO|nr:Nramp family divalent metal transporter [Vicingus serpentipes]TXB65499.1 divalent metal cation transporter [Vicingus serpentipes]
MKTPWYKILGPGLLYAGAAIGVSHLVQSTRAGADFGYGLVWAILIANFLKYPFFEFGPRYAASTGNSLLYGYKAIGNWALYLFIAITFISMFIIQSAVTVVTAGLASEISGLDISPWLMSTILLAICTSILLVGKYTVLDKVMKVIILTLSVSTIIALVAAFTGHNEQYQEYMVSFTFSEKSHVLFLIALMGWMPAPFDISVWHSLWTAEKNNHQKSNLKEALLDFKIGYWGTMILALCFVSLGAITIYGSGIELQNSGGAFAKQLIGIYTNNIGSCAYFVIAIAAFTTMLSTTITCLDASPRTLTESCNLIIGNAKYNKKFYILWILILAIGTVFILAFYLTNMKALVDFATTLAFLSSPIIAILNYLVITGKTMPTENKPSLLLKGLSWLGIIYFIGFSIYFLILTNSI